MNRLLVTLQRALADLEDLRAPNALIGGLAISARTEPRFTRDVDVAIAVADDTQAEAIVHGLQARGYRLGKTIEQTATGRLATARLELDTTGRRPALVDVLFASSGIEPEVVAAAAPLVIAKGVTAQVATTAHLIALKVLSRDDLRRPRDLQDLRALLAVAVQADLVAAEAALMLIQRRGYARGKDLLADLTALRAADPR